MIKEKKIRVLQVGMSPYFGGTESFIMNQYRCLDRNKVQFDFLNVYQEEIACQEEIINMGGKIYYLNMARHHGLRAYYKTIDSFFAENAKNFQVVHCNYQSLINIDILKYAKKYQIPVRIAHAHNSGYGSVPTCFQKIIIRKNSKQIRKYATHYFACSTLAADWMFSREATIINNAIDVKKFRYSEEIRNKVRRENHLEGKKVILFVGRLDPQKNPLFLLDIAKELSKKWIDLQMIIVGDGVLKQDMEKKIVQLKIEKYVTMLGNRNDVNELLQGADFFLLPSLFEGLGIVLIEAQAAGVSTYTSKDVVPEAVKITELVHFISLNESAQEWANRIIENGVKNHMDTEESICFAGYDNHTNAEKLQKTYEKLVEKSNENRDNYVS